MAFAGSQEDRLMIRASAVRYAYGQVAKPIFVTENGISTRDDSVRAHYIPEVFARLKSAIDDGIPVIGCTGASSTTSNGCWLTVNSLDLHR
jgi:beta-glucosidase/6-phospho-beta-glucosidase/beta-galactosidase